jgi:hypothetical protein
MFKTPFDLSSKGSSNVKDRTKGLGFAYAPVLVSYWIAGSDENVDANETFMFACTAVVTLKGYR